MKEKTKNSLLIVIILLSIVGIMITINHAKHNLGSNDFSKTELKEQDKPAIEEQPDASSNNQSQKESPPEIPDNERKDEPNTKNFKNTQEPPNERYDKNKPSITLTMTYKIIFVILSTLFSLCLIYFIMSISNKKFYKNKDKLMIYILSNIILTSILSISTIYCVNNYILGKKTTTNNSSSEKEEVTLNKENIVNDSMIDLNNQKEDITITKGGTYTVNGKFEHSIIINVEKEEVELILNNVEIENQNTAAIIGLNAKKITINLAENSKNTLTDGGNSKYDGCIWSQAELEFTGSGTLTVNGKQNEGEGIATETQNITFNGGNYTIISNDDGINAGGDGATITINDGTFYIDASGDGIDSNKNAIINGGTIFVIGSDIGGDAGIDTETGFTINGGNMIALGSDMIETPLNSSKQKSLAFTLDKKVDKDTIVTLMKDEKEIISFQANKSFKTMIISNNKLENGTYSLYSKGTHTGSLVNGIYENGKYTEGEKLTVNNSDTFNVSKIVNNFGNSSHKR